jgi:hypothetical protein
MVRRRRILIAVAVLGVAGAGVSQAAEKRGGPNVRVVTPAASTTVAPRSSDKAPTFGSPAHDVDGDGIVSGGGEESMPDYVEIGPGLSGKATEPRYIKATDLYPVNNASADINVQPPAPGPRTVSIYNRDGKKIDEIVVDAGSPPSTTVAPK